MNCVQRYMKKSGRKLGILGHWAVLDFSTNDPQENGWSRVVPWVRFHCSLIVNKLFHFLRKNFVEKPVSKACSSNCKCQVSNDPSSFEAWSMEYSWASDPISGIEWLYSNRHYTCFKQVESPFSSDRPSTKLHLRGIPISRPSSTSSPRQDLKALPWNCCRASCRWRPPWAGSVWSIGGRGSSTSTCSRLTT